MIAAGLAPDSCSVVRVMTPHPDTALPSTSILDALKKMHGKKKSNDKNKILKAYNFRRSLLEFTCLG